MALLVGGVAVSGFRVIAFEDDPQRGTAFAMFATVDIAANRRVIVTVPGAPGVVEIPATLYVERRRLQVVPTQDQARRFAALVLDADPALSTVRVQVLGLDTDGRAVTRQVHVDVVEPGR